MSNVEQRPDEVACVAGSQAGVEVIEPREVPLGGPRAMTVRRTLPSRSRSLVGAWCIGTPRRSSPPPLRSSTEQRRGDPAADHYGPDPVEATGGMSVAPHPHTGLQTVSWLFTGEIEHRDSAGHHATVRPGELNLMSAGRGISHSEVSTADTAVLHGVQLWVALPDAARHGEPGFVRHVPTPVRRDGLEARVFLGSLLDDTSPVATATALLGAELRLVAGADVTLDVDPAFEHGVLVDAGDLRVAGHPASTHDLVYLPPGARTLRLVADGAPARLLLLGGPPFGEAIIMWWNFVGRSHEEVVSFREQWQAQLGDGTLSDGPFGVPLGDVLPPIPAPVLPRVRLRERR